MAAAKKPPGKGLMEKRGRLVRLLEGHVRYLELAAALVPWAPPERPERPPRPPDPDPYRLRPASHFYTPREKPELAHPCDGLEAITEEQIKAWVEVDPFVRGGLALATVRGLCFIETFRGKNGPLD
jgi:hypothetical protein